MKVNLQPAWHTGSNLAWQLQFLNQLLISCSSKIRACTGQGVAESVWRGCTCCSGVRETRLMQRNEPCSREGQVRINTMQFVKE
jgi:hypothetical protein